METEKPISKSSQVRAALVRRYPCAEVPHGAFTTLGTEFGVSRELVRQIARKLGMGKLRAERLKPIRVCACGKQLEPEGNGLCQDCRWVNLPCEWCGKPKKVLASLLAWRIARGSEYTSPDGRKISYSGRVFCNRSCMGLWLGREHGRGAQRRKAGLPPASEADHGTGTRYNSGCRCRACKDVHNVEQRKYRRPRPKKSHEAKHGTVNEYKNHGCRCDACKAAASEFFKTRYARRKAERLIAI